MIIRISKQYGYDKLSPQERKAVALADKSARRRFAARCYEEAVFVDKKHTANTKTTNRNIMSTFYTPPGR
jgi:hypothetical protein